MSALMRLSISEQKEILRRLVVKRSKKFNKEYSKVLRTIEENDILKNYEKKVKDLKEEFQRELNSITTDDVGWERHESKGAEIERKFNKKLLDIKYEINSILDLDNEIKKLNNKYKKDYEKYEKQFNQLNSALEKDDKYKNLKIEKVEFKNLSKINDIKQANETLKQELEKIEDIQKKYNIVSNYDFSNYEAKKLVIHNELDEALEKIKSLSEKEYQRIKNLQTDEKLKIKEAKVIYQRLLHSKIYQDEIETILEDMPEYLKEKFKTLKQKEIIYKNEYEKLLDEYYNQESDEVSIDKIVDAFEEMGYKFEEVVLNQKGYIDTDKEDYKIAYRIDDGKLSLAFTRLVEEEPNEYEREKDKKEAKKWCSNFNKITELLDKQGIHLEKEMVKEPEEVEIRYEKVESKKGYKNYAVNERKMEK